MRQTARLSTDLKRVKGLGAGGGVHHWWVQRLTALLNIPLVIYLVYSAMEHNALDYATALAWVQQPLNAFALALFSLNTFYHALLGVQVVIEDYIHHNGFKFFSIISKKIGFFLLSIACIFAVMSIYFKG